MCRTLPAIIFLAIFPLLVSGQLRGVRSKLEVYHLATEQRSVIYESNSHFEAPNWSKDGQYFIINGGGRLYKLSTEGQQKTLINTDFADKCNNDHGITPDGQQLIISHYDQPQVAYEDRNFRSSRIYKLPIGGGTPQPITSETPSFWHGISPDGQTLLYTALRNEEFDIYSISIEGGKETKLTTAEGLDDGSEFSHDGRYIYYNSMASGSMEIWRMDADGDNPVQITDDAYSNWFPHPSPDGKYLVYLAYLKDQGDKHPAMKKVALKLYNLQTKTTKTIAQFTGGQGTINVNSWSPDGSAFAFVSYESIVFD
ncbi:MAG: transporter [Bacteroidota bacterium]